MPAGLPSQLKHCLLPLPPLHPICSTIDATLSGTLPVEGWAALSSLASLDLSHNRLQGTLAAAFPASLQKLNLRANDLTAISPGWRPPPGLVHMDMAANSLQQPLSELAGWLTAAPELEVLFLYYNKLHGTVPADLVLPPRLVQLSLLDNQLSGRCAGGSVQGHVCKGANDEVPIGSGCPLPATMPADSASKSVCTFVLMQARCRPCACPRRYASSFFHKCVW